MFLELIKNNGKEYLRLVSGKRIIDKNGNSSVRKTVLLNLGPISQYDDGQPDYFERLRQSFKNGEPLIDELIPYLDAEKNVKSYSVTFRDGIECIGHPKYFSHILLDRILTELGVNALFTTLKHDYNIEYDIQGLMRLMIFGRILNPASKISTYYQNNDYYQRITDETGIHHIYDLLDIIYENKEKIIRRMNTELCKKQRKTSKTVYYDVTNFFFEVDDPDEDYEEGGEFHKGLRKTGVSKEQRKQPIVQMGLFLDENGLPITIDVFPGNTLDQATFRPAVQKTLEPLGLNRFVLVADRGLCSYKNICCLKNLGHGYIVSKSIKKTAKSEREWILEPDDYIYTNPNFRYKSRLRTRTVKDDDGILHTITEKVVVYWSKDFYAREYHENQSFLEFIQKLKESPASFRITTAQSKCLRKFLKKEVVDLRTGESIRSKDLLTMLDESKLNEFTDYMGYYQIVSSEIDMDPLEIIDKYHGLTQIEDQFRVMKGDLQTRPIFVNTEEHIQAHLIICLIALIVLRMIQRQISSYLPNNCSKYWSYGMSAERVINALRKWQIDSFPGELYRFNYLDDPDLLTILNAFKIHIPHKLYTRGALRKIKGQISII